MEYTLDDLGFLLNEIKKLVDEEFRALAAKCKYRKKTVYETDANGNDYRGWQCTHPELEDKEFNWGCKFSSCPCISLDPGVDERDYYIIN